MMKIVKILGGLGNQMFQYALLTALRQQHPHDCVMADLHVFHNYRRSFQLDTAFGIRPVAATLRDVARVAYPYPSYAWWRCGSRLLPPRKTMCVEPSNFSFVDDALERTGNTYYDGYWQNERYFSHCRTALVEQFRFPLFTDERNRQLAQLAEQKETAALHVRRTDYIGDRLFHDISATDYYARALQLLKQQTHTKVLCIFSDDMEWCRQHLSHLTAEWQVAMVDWNHGAASIQDMHLMTLCRHHVIANSSFSWWGAWLADTPGLNMAPRLWWRRQTATTPVPQHWTIL